MVFILEYLFIFITGAIIGWSLELIYRRYFGLSRKWMNPGFLSGPYLPLYGTGVCLLYILCRIQMALPLRVILFALLTTGIEYVTGAFFLKKYNVRLWDYSSEKFNLRGHIAPLYTFFWTILSLLFYYVLYPYLYRQVQYIYVHLELSLLIGIFYGILLVDISNSFDVLNRLLAIKDALGEKKAIIHLESLKEEMTHHMNNIHDKIDDLGNGIHDTVEDIGNELYNRVEGIGNKITHNAEKTMEKNNKPSFFLPFKNKIQLRVFIENILKK